MATTSKKKKSKSVFVGYTLPNALVKQIRIKAAEEGMRASQLVEKVMCAYV